MKPILDVTCGGRMMWFNKQNPACLYLNNRELPETHLCDGRKFSVHPDILANFTDLPFADDTFYLVVFDPPHLINVSDRAYMKIKFERLGQEWPQVIHDGFAECMRVLKPYGTLIFKW